MTYLEPSGQSASEKSVYTMDGLTVRQVTKLIFTSKGWLI